MFGAASLAGISAAALGLAGPGGASTASEVVVSAATVEIAPGSFDFPLPDESLMMGRSAAASTRRVEFHRPLRVMKYQVSFADYRRCVEAGGCLAADARPAPDGAAVPVTGVNYLDASAYAAWYSKATGRSWRLPTAAEWAFAAGERFIAVAEKAPAGDPGNPAVAWISRYRQEAAAERKPDPRPRAQGTFGANGSGVWDMAGNVFEWTSTCLDGEERADCGSRVLEGRHRSYMAAFIRNGRSGGCAVGAVPENLGFRLVLDDGLVARLRDFGRRIGGLLD
jgi:formylglycine-generating enzyme required for sulfatase activity